MNHSKILRRSGRSGRLLIVKGALVEGRRYFVTSPPLEACKVCTYSSKSASNPNQQTNKCFPLGTSHLIKLLLPDADCIACIFFSFSLFFYLARKPKGCSRGRDQLPPFCLSATTNLISGNRYFVLQNLSSYQIPKIQIFSLQKQFSLKG